MQKSNWNFADESSREISSGSHTGPPNVIDIYTKQVHFLLHLD